MSFVLDREEMLQFELEARLEAAELENARLKEEIARLTTKAPIDLNEGHEFAPNSLPLLSSLPNVCLNHSGYLVMYDKTRDLFILVHKRVSEEKIGRPLRPNEQSHHLDRNRLNCTAENLVVLTREDHKRVHELLRQGHLTTAKLFIEEHQITE